MNEGEDFMKDIMNTETPEVEVIGGEKEEIEIDIQGQINALKSERDALMSQNNESNQPRIDALSRRIMELEEKQRSTE